MDLQAAGDTAPDADYRRSDSWSLASPTGETVVGSIGAQYKTRSTFDGQKKVPEIQIDLANSLLTARRTPTCCTSTFEHACTMSARFIVHELNAR